MGDILFTDGSSAYRTENDRELCRELDALEELRRDDEHLAQEDRSFLCDEKRI